MLRLWPEPLSVGLFAQASWLRAPGFLRPGTSQEGPGLDDAEAMLDQLLSCLPSRHPGRLDLLLSDSHARLVALPWQDSLNSPSDLRGYAHACFARHGLALDGNWVSQQGFRHYRQPGLAVALPRGPLERLAQRALSGGLKLRSVLPVSAAAYWHGRPAMRKGRVLLLLADQAQCSMLSLENGMLSAFDTQPAMGDAMSAIVRLLRRAQARAEDCREVVCWEALAGLIDADFLRAIMPQAPARMLPRHCWE